MPIRFRCAYCTQLMSIARRKAGAVVRCPKCAGEIIVPVPEGAASSGAAFDDDNFDVQLEPGNDANAPASTPSGPPPVVDAPMPTVPPTPAVQRVGFFVPLGMMIISGVVVLLVVVLAFVIGLIIGRQSVLPG